MPARAWVAGYQEAESVARLLVAFRDWMGKDWPSANAFLASVERLSEDPKTEYLLATPDDDSPPTGVCQLRFRHSVWTASDAAGSRTCSSSTSRAGRALGSALIELALDRARARGCRRIELDTNQDNPAVALYERFGFSSSYKTPDSLDLFLGRRLGDEE